MDSHLWGETKYPDPSDQPPLPEDSKVSGAQGWVDPLDRWEKPEPQAHEKLDLLSLILGILSAVTSCVGAMALVFGVGAIAAGIVYKAKKPAHARLSGYGIALGCIGVITALLAILFPQLFEALNGIAGALMPH